MTEDHQIVYFSYSLDPEVDVPGQEDIFRVDPGTGEIRRVTDDSTRLDFVSDRNPTWSPQRDRIAIHRTGGGQDQARLCVVDAATGDTTTTLAEGHSAIWLDDDRLLHLTAERYGTVVVTRVSDGTRREVLVMPDGSDIAGMSWHPVGGLVLGFGDSTTPWWRIGRIRPEALLAALDGEPAGADQMVLYGRVGASLAMPSWHPDGNLLCVSQFGPEGNPAQSAIGVLDLAAGSYRTAPRPDDQLIDVFGCWSPDGTQIAYTRTEQDVWSEIWLYDPAAGTTRQLTDEDHKRAKGALDW